MISLTATWMFIANTLTIRTWQIFDRVPLYLQDFVVFIIEVAKSWLKI